LFEGPLFLGSEFMTPLDECQGLALNRNRTEEETRVSFGYAHFGKKLRVGLCKAPGYLSSQRLLSNAYYLAGRRGHFWHGSRDLCFDPIICLRQSIR
jgi:hypothetical protein